MKRFYLLLTLLCASRAHANTRVPDVARSSHGFQLAVPGYKWAFPRDHGSHPAFATEWWYYTGHLRAQNGRRFGYQLTWFRQGLVPQLKGRTSKWATRDIVFAHFAITDEKGRQFHFCDKIARSAAGVAGSSTRISNRVIWIGNWDLRFHENRQIINARGTSQNNAPMALQLVHTPTKPIVFNGQNGVSQKSQGVGQASHYYSMTRLQSRGTLKLGNETFQVTGSSWLDREWGSNQLGKNQVGWDWFAIQLDDGRDVMLYRMRLRGGGTDKFSSGTLVDKNGRSQNLQWSRSDFTLQPLTTWKSPHTRGVYPSTWRVRVPRAKLDLKLIPTLADQELRATRSVGIAYWEGNLRVLDAKTNRPIGRAYMELTGYDKPFSKTF